MNNLTLICDMNYVLMSRYSFAGKFEKNSPQRVLEADKENLTSMLARSINIVLNRFPVIDNVILISDGGSWRKQLPIPEQLKDVTYKGNREQQTNVDWGCVFESLSNVMLNAKEVGITTSNTLSAEGDDWIWYWTKRLNSQGINTLIWSVDRDLQQLIQRTNDGTFTAWYNDKAGLYLPKYYKEEKELDPIDFFMTAQPFDSKIVDTLKTNAGKVNYINPDEVVIEKVLCGDSGDNIKAVVRYTKNDRIYRFSEGDLKKYQESDIPMFTVEDLKDRFDDIADWIVNSKKFKPYKFKKQDILEMLNYNLHLVWLNENIIPQPIVQAMNTVEYKKFDVNSLRNNYKLLAKTKADTDIESIFEEL